MDYNRIKGVATKIFFSTISASSPEDYLPGVAPTLEAIYVDAWGVPQPLALAASPVEMSSLAGISVDGLWYLDLSAAEANHDVVLINMKTAGGVEDTLTIYFNAITAQVPTVEEIVAGMLAAEGITGVLQDLETLVDSEVISITRGDAKRLTFSLGTAWNLTGRKAYLCVKKKKTDLDSASIVNRVITITDVVNGVGYIDLTTDETNNLGFFDAEVEVRDTDESDPNTALTFKIQFTQDVRQGS
jgi:hypothetical protein